MIFPCLRRKPLLYLVQILTWSLRKLRRQGPTVLKRHPPPELSLAFRFLLTVFSTLQRDCDKRQDRLRDLRTRAMCAWGTGWSVSLQASGLTHKRRRSDEGEEEEAIRGRGLWTDGTASLSRPDEFGLFVTQNHWDRPEAVITPLFSSSTVSGCGCRGINWVPGRPRWHSGEQDASGREALSGGRDEDATLFCGECRFDPEWDKPHVSVDTVFWRNADQLVN